MANATGAEKFAAELVEGNQRETRAHEDERIHLRIARCAAEPIAFLSMPTGHVHAVISYRIESALVERSIVRAGQPLAETIVQLWVPASPDDYMTSAKFLKSSTKCAV